MKKKKIAVFVSIFVLIGVVVAAVAWRAPKDPYEGAVFERAVVRDLKQTVSVTGSVKPASEVTLGFETSGRVTYIAKTVGSHMLAGTLLASLNTSDLVSDLQKADAGIASARAQLQQVQAALKTQKVKLVELQKGTRPEQVKVKQIERDAAITTLNHLFERTPTDVLLDVFSRAQQGIEEDTDHFFDNDYTINPRVTFVSTYPTGILPSSRVRMTDALLGLKNLLLIDATNGISIKQALAQANQYLMIVQEYLSALNLAWNGAIHWTDATPITETERATEKGNLISAQALIQSGFDEVQSREQAIKTQEEVIDLITQELAVLTAPATVEQTDAQQAMIVQAEATVAMQEANFLQAEAVRSNVQAQFSKRVIRAPFSGTITRQDLKVGEIVSMNAPLINFISDAGFQVEASVPEVDLSYMRVGQAAQVVLDAYSGVVFSAEVRSIDPAATFVEGVATYRTLFAFSTSDERLKSGMSADVDVLTAERQSVLTISYRAVTTRDGKTFVRIRENGDVREREVRLGIRAEGLVEVTEGLQEGEEVFVREARKL